MEREMQTQTVTAPTGFICGSQGGLHRGGTPSLTLKDEHKFAKQKKYARWWVRANGH